MRRNRREGGFTLVELMVVIVLIGLLAGIVTVKVIPMIAKAKVKTTQAQIKTFANALDLYKLNVGSYPDTLEELTEEAPNGDERLLAEIPQDPWGQEYIYDSTGGDPYILLSLGPDEREGTEDDVTTSTRKDDDSQ